MPSYTVEVMVPYITGEAHRVLISKPIRLMRKSLEAKQSSAFLSINKPIEVTVGNVAGEGLFFGEYVQANGRAGSTGTGISPAAIFPDTSAGNRALCEFIAYSKLMPGPNVTPAQIIAQNKIQTQVYASNELSELLYNISNPTLIMYGDQDVVLTPENSEYLYYNISSAEEPYSGIGSGHAYLFQAYENVTQLISEFLEYYDYYDYEELSYDAADSWSITDHIHCFSRPVGNGNATFLTSARYKSIA